MKLIDCQECEERGAIRKCERCNKALCNECLNATMYEVEGELIECDRCLGLRENCEDHKERYYGP